MRQRRGFTMVEMLVSVALVIFIMVILSEAFVAGLETFRQLKAIGDMEERLRAAAQVLRRDLAADHFEGKRRLSDPDFWLQGPPREGFFRIWQTQVPQDPTDDRSLFDKGDEPQTASAPLTRQDVKSKRSPHQGGPTPPTPLGGPCGLKIGIHRRGVDRTGQLRRRRLRAAAAHHLCAATSTRPEKSVIQDSG